MFLEIFFFFSIRSQSGLWLAAQGHWHSCPEDTAVVTLLCAEGQCPAEWCTSPPVWDQEHSGSDPECHCTSLCSSAPASLSASPAAEEHPHCMMLIGQLQQESWGFELLPLTDVRGHWTYWDLQSSSTFPLRTSLLNSCLSDMHCTVRYRTFCIPLCIPKLCPSSWI